MKIKYNLEYNFFTLFNEAQGISFFKYLIYKNEEKPIKNFISRCLNFLKIPLVLFVITCISIYINEESFLASFTTNLCAISCAIIAFFFGTFIFSYIPAKMRCHRGEMTINKNGILDTTDEGIRIGLPWHLIEALIITDRVICFTTKAIALFFIDSEQADKVIEAVKKVQPDLKIIDKRFRPIVKIDEKADEEAKLITPSLEKEEEVSKEEKKEEQKTKSVENKERLDEVKDDVKEENAENDTEVEDKINELEGN